MSETTERARPEYLSTGAVADMFSVQPATVRNWERARKLTAIRTPGGQRRFRRSDVEALLAEAEAAAS